MLKIKSLKEPCTEAYLELTRISRMEIFAKLVNGSIAYVRLGSTYASGVNERCRKKDII